MEDYLRLVSVVYESDVKYHGAEDQFRGGPLSHDSGTHDDSDTKAPSLTMMATALSFLESNLFW